MNSSVVVTPSPLSRFGYALFECVGGGGMIALAQPWQGPMGVQRTLLVVVGVFLIVAGIEFPWRKVVISEKSVREMLWFHWRTHDLPHRVIVGRDSRGRVAVAEAPTGRIVVRFVREFGRPAAIEKKLVEFFERSGRLEPAL